MAKKKKASPSKEPSREDIVNLLWKINSEGISYFFGSYTSASSVEEDLKSLKGSSFITAAYKFEKALQDLESEMDKLKDKHEIDDEEILS